MHSPGRPAFRVDSHTGERLGAELVRLVKVLVAMRHQLPAVHPAVEHAHYPVLFTLRQQPRRVSDLAGCVHADVSTISRQVSHLVAHGLLAKAPDPHDRRVWEVALTDAGHVVLDQVIEARGAWIAEVLAAWTEAEARDFLAHLTRFTDSVETAKAALTATPTPPSPPA